MVIAYIVDRLCYHSTKYVDIFSIMLGITKRKRIAPCRKLDTNTMVDKFQTKDLFYQISDTKAINKNVFRTFELELTV